MMIVKFTMSENCYDIFSYDMKWLLIFVERIEWAREERNWIPKIEVDERRLLLRAEVDSGQWTSEIDVEGSRSCGLLLMEVAGEVREKWNKSCLLEAFDLSVAAFWVELVRLPTTGLFVGDFE